MASVLNNDSARKTEAPVDTVQPAASLPTQAPTPTPSLPPSTSPPSASATPSPPPQLPRPTNGRFAQRFVMNKVDKAWIVTQLITFGAPLQKMKTLDATCARFADSARMRHVPDSHIISEQNTYGMSWRRAYMNRITGDNERHVANTVADMAKKVVIASMTGSVEDGGPVAAARGRENDAQHVLDQAVLDYKHEASKRSLTTDDYATRALTRTKELRSQKDQRNRERKAAFEQNKRRRNELREARERRRLAADMQNLQAQTRIANAANASAALQRRQSEQFGILVDLFAKATTFLLSNRRRLLRGIPPPLTADPPSIDPDILATSEAVTAGVASSNASGASGDALTNASAGAPEERSSLGDNGNGANDCAAASGTNSSGPSRSPGDGDDDV